MSEGIQKIAMQKVGERIIITAISDFGCENLLKAAKKVSGYDQQQFDQINQIVEWLKLRMKTLIDRGGVVAEGKLLYGFPHNKLPKYIAVELAREQILSKRLEELPSALLE